MENVEINYNISLYPSKFHGHWKPTGNINLYVSTIWHAMEDEFPHSDDSEKVDKFMDNLSNIILIETVCLYRSKNKVKLKNKCKPHCKVARIANYLVFPDDWKGIRKFYKQIDEDDKNENP